MRSSARSVLLVVLVALVVSTLTSCGKPKIVGRRVHEAGGVAPAKQSDAPDALRVNDSVRPYDGYGAYVAPGTFPRTVHHAMGDAIIPAEPKRVVTLTAGDLDTVLTLGVTPVGSTDVGPGERPPYIEPADLAGVAPVGSAAAPDLAAIAALQPDLILGNTVQHRALYPQLSQIAPTVFGGQVDVAWKLNARLTADALGLEKKERAVEERYKARVAEVAASFPRPKPKMSVVRVMPGILRIYQRANFVAQVLTDLGITRPRQQMYDRFAVDTTFDHAGDAYGEIIFVAADDAGLRAYVDELESSAPWQAMLPVKEDRVRLVDFTNWIEGSSFSAAFAVLDELEDFYEDPALHPPT
jgi:iron complex transport system substrate-binding protein